MSTRKAVIIASPRGGQFLDGVAKDISNMTNYLCSPKGGLWKREEVIVLYDPLWRKAITTIHNTIADYQMVYFTGHGCTIDNERAISINNTLINDQILLSESPRQLILIDSCRTVSRGIGSIPPAIDALSSFTGDNIGRQLFDQYILHSPCGKIMVHGTHKDSFAKDSAEFGGAFTYHLLKVASSPQPNEDFSAVFIDEIITTTNEQLAISGIDQRPEVVYRDGDLHVPFMINVPQIEITSIVANQIPTNNLSIERLKIAAGFLAFAGVLTLLGKVDKR